MGLMQKWGLGVELRWDGSQAEAGMTRSHRGVMRLRNAFEGLKAVGNKVQAGAQTLGLALAPVGLAAGFLAQRASASAAALEAQSLTMEVLLGSAEKARELLSAINIEAAKTPFQEGDLIEGSKRLLRLTGSNIGLNLQLMKVLETMTALNPTKNITDSVEALLDATSGGGFERLKEFGLTFRAEMFKGAAGSSQFKASVIETLAKEIERMTGGRDLVQRLSDTFGGRLSTFKDSLSNNLRAVGEVINEALGPLLPDLAATVNANRPLVVGAVREIAEEIRGLWDNYLNPLVEQGKGLWASLGVDGQRTAIKLGIGFMAVAAGVTAVGGALAAVGLVVSGVAGLVASPLWAALAALVPGAGWLLAIAGAAGLVAAKFEWVTMMARTLGGAFTEAVGPRLAAAWGVVKDAASSLGAQVMAMLDSIMGSSPDVDFWRRFGFVLGEIVGKAVQRIAFLFDLASTALSVMLTIIQPVVAVVLQLGKLLVGVATGSLTVGSAFEIMGRAILGVVLSIGTIVASTVMGMVELALKTVAELVREIPGGEKAANRLGDVATGFGDARKSMTDEITRLISGAERDKAEARREEAKAAAPTVVAKPGEVSVNNTVETSVKLEGEELARALGGNAVKSGERGTGPKLPPSQAPRVLRGGGQVSPLGALEVLPVAGGG